MPKSKAWIAPYILAVLLAGPLLNSLAWVQFVSIPDLQLSGSHAIRPVADLFALATPCMFAFAAFQQVPDSGRGSGFLRDLSRAKLRTRAANTSPHGVSYSLNPYLLSTDFPRCSSTTLEGEH